MKFPKEFDSWNDAVTVAKEAKLSGQEGVLLGDDFIVVLNEQTIMGYCEWVYQKKEGPITRVDQRFYDPKGPCCPFGVKDICDAYHGEE